MLKRSFPWIAAIAVGIMLAAGAPATSQDARPSDQSTQEAALPTTADPRIQQAQKLEAQFETLYAAHRFAEALPLARQVLTLREEALGPVHELVGRSCFYLGAVLDELDDDAAAQQAFERALRIAEATLGPEHIEVLNILWGLYVALSKQGQIGAASALEERKLRLTEKNFGADHPRLADALVSSAAVLEAHGEYATARTRLERGLAIYQKAFGPYHRDVARTILELGSVSERQADYVAAGQLYGRALQIYEKALGPENPDVAQTLGKLGDIAREQGDFTTARQLYERALKMSEKVSGPDHVDFARALGYLGLFYEQKGDYVSARPLLERALAINEKVYGPEHPFIATQLNNLAALISEQGDHATARKLHERALKLWESMYGSISERVATGLGNLAKEYADERNYAAAEPLSRRAVEVNEKLYGPEHPAVAISLNNLARTLIDQGKFAGARPLLERAIQIGEKALGPENATLAMFINNLGFYYRLQGDNAAARHFYERGLSITEKVFGHDHLQVAYGLINVATVDWLQKDYQRAQDRLLRVSDILDVQSRTLLPSLSLAEQSAFIGSNLSFQVDRLLQTTPNGAALMRAYGVIFRWKGLLIESLREQTALTRLADDPVYKPQVERLRTLRAQIAGWYLKAGSVPLAQWTEQNDTLTREKEGIERALARAAKRVALEDPLRSIDLQGFRAILGEDEALVDLFGRVVFGSVAQGIDHYVAVVTSRKEDPRLVDLGPSQGIDKAVSRWRSAVLDQREATQEWQNLAALLLKPLQETLPPATRKVWISPDGELSRLPWQLLFADKPDTAQLLVSQTDSPREIVWLRQGNWQVARAEHPRLLLAGGIDFNAEAGGMHTVQKSGSFAALPSTVLEVSALEKLARTAHLDVLLMTGSQATKEAVQEKLASAQYAHLATHGFFYAETEAAGRSRNIASRGADTGTAVKDARNPLVESGLAFAGANVRDASTFEARGLLTAEELVGSDLRNTDLVVLSACDTGRGEQITGQGVMGLRASFVASGTRSVIMSLWKVPDEATSRLMQAFYTNLWTKKMPKALALQQAQQSVRDDPSGRFRAPIHWAGWVLAGEGW